MGTCSSLRRRMMMGSVIPSVQQIEVITPVLINNIYIIPNGTEAAYNGWSATDYIDISGFKFVYMYNNPYWSFYDQSKSPIGRTTNVFGKKTIPTNAFYLRFSNTTAAMGNCKLILSNFELFPTTLPIYRDNAYVNAKGGITTFNGWNISRVSQLDGYQGVFYHEYYNASYTSDGEVITLYSNYLPNEESVSYILFSDSSEEKNVYLIPKL